MTSVKRDQGPLKVNDFLIHDMLASLSQIHKFGRFFVLFFRMTQAERISRIMLRIEEGFMTMFAHGSRREMHRQCVRMRDMPTSVAAESDEADRLPAVAPSAPPAPEYEAGSPKICARRNADLHQAGIGRLVLLVALG